MPVDLERLDASLRASLDCGSGETPSGTLHVRRGSSSCSHRIFAPIVVFPSWALAEIPPAELNAILLHELAHLRRYDDWTNLAQKIVKAVFFFHPAVWFIESRLTLEREMACDDAVLAANFSPRAYAESLVGLAERSFLRRGVQLAQAAVGHVQQLKTRLAEILRKDKDRQGSGRAWKPAVALMSLVGMAPMYGIARAPRLVAFSGGLIADRLGRCPAHFFPAASVHLRPVSLRYRSALATGGFTENLPSSANLAPDPAERSEYASGARAPRRTDVPIPADMQALLLADFPMELAPAPVLLVFRSEQFGLNGPVFWHVTVFRLTPAQQRAITGGVPKKDLAGFILLTKSTN